MTMTALPRPELVSVNIPFAGFYDSMWSDLVDVEAEQWLEHVEEEPDRYSPEEVLCAKHGELGELLWDHTRYTAAYLDIAKDYASAYFWWLAESLGFPVHVDVVDRTSEVTPGFTWVIRTPRHPIAWEWEELESPRFYNFATDRIFAKVDRVLIRELYRQLMLVDNRWAFELAVKESFTSYDGFSSNYSNDADALAAKPLEDWDHNELKMLLLGWEAKEFGVRSRGAQDELYEQLADEGYTYFDNAVDWEALREACREKALEWLDEDELTEDERYRLEHPRCAETLELPLAGGR